MFSPFRKSAGPVVKRTSTCNSTKSNKLTKHKQKALIVAIMYRNKEGETLLSPHKDAQAWRTILMEKYGYKDRDITLMLDDEDTIRDRPDFIPSKDNLLREIEQLVKGAKSGDRFMFYYAGHGKQIPSDSMDEEDGFDEAIIPYDPDGNDELILDDVLRDLLVNPLPIGATLMAIFDSCCSGTLLDLDHYACNNVFFPWVNRGKRDLRSTRRAFLRRRTVVDDFTPVKLDLKPSDQSFVSAADDTHSEVSTARQPFLRICQWTRSKSDGIVKRDQVINDTAPGKKDATRFVVTRSATLEVPRRDNFNVEKRKPRRVFSIPHKFTFKGIFFNSEPETYLACDGFHCKAEKKTKPDVISISACQDIEQTWDSKKGPTMTQSMIKLLKRNPNMPIRQLIERVGHSIYRGTTLKLHRWSQTQLKEWRAHHSPGEDMRAQYEIFNSPKPQIGSMNVLPLNEPFCA